MKITWVTRSFLDYRIPVYKELDKICGNRLSVIYYADVVPDRCQKKLRKIIGSRAKGLTGELRFSGKKYQPASGTKIKGLRIPFQPGLIKTILETKPDIILTDGFYQWTYAALVLKLLYRIPHIMCYEATRYTENGIGTLRILYRRLSSLFIDHIVCNGSLSRDYVISLGFPEEKISLGNMTTDVEDLYIKSSSIRQSENIQSKTKESDRPKSMMFIGRLVPLKGVDLLIDAWNNIHKSNSEIQLLIIGDGEQKELLMERCMVKGISNISFPGRVDYDSIYKYLSAADILIIPSLRDNWSLVVPEAMSCGLPVICSKYNGCWPELVKPENGWVFDPLDPVNFTSTLKIAWDKKENWKEMGQQSLRIIQDFTPDKIAGNIYKACKNLKK